MGLCCGLIGLPNVGKTTVFNALVGARGAIANYPFSTVETSIGVSTIPDARVSKIAEIFRSKKITPSTLEIRDIAGLVAGASHGEGLGNQFLAQIREVDALLHLVRCFEDPNVVHVVGDVNPLRDIEIIETELMLADLETMTRRRQRLEKRVKTGDDSVEKELTLLARIEELLNQGTWLHDHLFSADDKDRLREFQLLSAKPVLYVANVAEGSEADEPAVRQVIEAATRRGGRVLILQGQLEAELADLSESERLDFFRELGLKGSGLQRLVEATNELLGLLTFFTAGEQEARAWTITNGTLAQEAAGKIHSDMQRGFIRAEVFTYEDLIACGNSVVVREKGLLRLEGRDYRIKDGDIVHFRFNV